MKTTILISIFLIESFSSIAQLNADAGENLHRCNRDSIVQLGGSPTAIGGSQPYFYKWSIIPIATGSQSVPFVYASNMLDDTTVSNPEFIYNGGFLPDSLAIFLEITDNDGNQEFDTISVTTSIFNIHLYSWNYNIEIGDSVFLNQTPNIAGGYGETSYLWNPSHGLSDTNLAFGFWSKPDSSVSYTATVSDSKGCSKTAQEPTYHVIINTASINELDLSRHTLSIYPNPVENVLQISNNTNEILSISVFDIDGSKQIESSGNIKLINLENLKFGVYLIDFKIANGDVIRKRFIKN